MSNFYFTFPSDSHIGHCYVKVEGKDWNDARQKVVDAIGRHFAFQYTELEFLPQISKWNYSEIDLMEAYDELGK